MAPPTPTQRLNEIEPRIEKIEEALRVSPPKPKSAFSQLCSEIWQWVESNWKVLIPICALAVAITSYFTAPWIKSEFDHRNDSRDTAIDARITSVLNAPGGVATTLAEVQKATNETNTTLKTLQPFIQMLVQREMIKNASLSQPDFKRNLPAIADSLAVARSQKAVIGRETISQIGAKLLKTEPAALGYWPAAAELINYRSIAGLPNQKSETALTNLPNCTDSAPQPMRVSEVLDRHTIKLSRGFYENCLFTLDSRQDDERLNAFLTKETPLITFKHCTIIYKGGPISLIIAWKGSPTTFRIEGQPTIHVEFTDPTLEFENCIFSFSIQNIPPPSGGQATRSLLAQTGATLTLPGG